MSRWSVGNHFPSKGRLFWMVPCGSSPLVLWSFLIGNFSSLMEGHCFRISARIKQSGPKWKIDNWFHDFTQEGLCDLLDEEGKESLEASICREASEKSPRAFWAFRRLGYMQVLSSSLSFPFAYFVLCNCGSAYSLKIWQYSINWFHLSISSFCKFLISF